MMAVGFVKSAVGLHNLHGSILTLSSLPRIDYADQFTLSTDLDATPESWARAMFGDVPSLAELLIWRGLLGFRLSRGRSPVTVAGWQIGNRGEDWIRLEAASWFLTGNLLVQRAGRQVSLVTFLHYRHWLGRVVWAPLSAVHRRLVPRVLRKAAARIRASR
jgi:hypothetical protein